MGKETSFCQAVINTLNEHFLIFTNSRFVDERSEIDGFEVLNELVTLM